MKTKNLKNRLISAILVLAMSFSMFVGATYSWFTDSVTSAGNKIVAGNLSVDLLHKDDDNWVSLKKNSNHKVFNYEKWEPGYTRVETLKVQNLGSLALKYKLYLNAEAGTAVLGANGEYLADVIEVYVSYGANSSKSYAEIKADEKWSYKGTLSEVFKNTSSFIGGSLLPTGKTLDGTEGANAAVGYQELSIALHMKEEAGNEYMKLSVGNVFVNLIAAQMSSESDSFDSTYDETSPFPEIKEGSVMASVKVENGVVSEAVTIQGEGFSAFVPAGVKVEEGVNTLVLTIEEIDESKANIVPKDGEEIRPMNVHVEGVAEDNDVPIIVDIENALEVGYNSGNYKLAHVEGGSTNDMTIVSSISELDEHNECYYDPATGKVYLAMAGFSEVVLVADTENAWNGTIAESFAGGEGTAENPYLIANADQLAYLGEVISNDNDNYGDKHYKLIANVNLGGEENANKGIIFYPIGYHKEGGEIAAADLDDAPEFLYFSDNYDDAGYAANRSLASAIADNGATAWYTYGGAFKGTFDGNGNKISNIYQNTWQLKGNYSGNYWNAAMGIFGYVYGGTVKNLTVDNFSSDGEFTPTGVIAAYAAGDATFENIAITNCNPRVYNTGNGGIIGIAGSTTAANDDHITLKNITVDNSNKISALWGSWDVACGGLVGMYRGNVDGSGNATGDTISFENCHVAAQIDVNNDVCANYQYYAYRYSGMIIGSVRHNTTSEEGRSIPNMTGISANGCTVHFGTWNDYYYCELVDNTTASYTHDYQMSRLVEIKAIDGTTITYLDGTTGTVPASGRANYVIVDYSKGHGTENATCYHFKNGEVWTHDMGGIQTGIDENGDGQDDLKEDKQHLYLEFNNLFTGYGWGVSSMGIDKWNGIEKLDVTTGDHEKSVEKFEGKVNELANNKEYKLGDIFNFVDNGVKLVPGALTVTVTNLDENNPNPVSATIVYDREDWESSTIIFYGTGSVKITIQDYYFCTPTEIEVSVVGRQLEEKFDVVMNNGDFLHRVGNSGAVAIDKLFKAKDGVSVGTVSVTVEAVNGTSASGTYSNNAIQFSGTGVVKVTVTDNDYCIPTELYLEVVDATNVTGLSGTVSGNVVLLNDCGLSSLTVSGRSTVYGNGFTATYTGNGQYLNNGLKQGVITVSENGMLDNLRIVAPIYPKAYLYYGSTTLGDYVQGGPSSTEGDKTRYHYQLSAVVLKGNATIQNCYIYGGRNNVFVDTGDVTIKDSILECGTVANVQIQSNASHTVTLEDVTTIQYQVNATVGDTSKVVMLGAGILVGPETTTNPTIVLNGDFKQYNWVTEDDSKEVSSDTTEMIINGALNATEYNHTINGKTASNLGIIYMNTDDAIVENNTGLPYEFGTVTMTASIGSVNGKAYSLQNATADQICSDYGNADKITVNGFYQPQFKYDGTLGGQNIEEGGDEHFYRKGDTIYVMFPSGDTKEVNLAALINIVKYSNQNLNLEIEVKDSNGKTLDVTDGKVTLSAADTYTVTYTVTDTLFYGKDGNTVSNSVEYSWNVVIEVSLKDVSVPNAYYEFDSTKQKMGYYKKSSITGTSIYQYIPFLAGLKIYDYNGQTAYLRFDGDTDFNKVASITVTNKYSGNDALVVVKLTDGGTITLQLLARADSGGGSTYTGTIKTSNNVIYFVNDGTTSDKEATTTAAYWYVDYYKFTGNNGVEITSAQQTFNSTGSSASTPSGSFSTTIKSTVTFDANGGNCSQTTGYATSASTAVTLPTPKRSGYIFAGWYTAASGGTRVGGAGESYTPSANITLYAQWGKPCDVTYDANGGSCGTASENYTGTALTLPAPTRDGYWFIGWYDAAEGGDKIGDAGAKYHPANEITLYAHWQQKIEYTVTYNANGGSCGTASATYQGTALTLPTPTLTGYTFNGWYTAASGGTKIGDAGATYVPSANITLYAQWTINSYKITVSTSNGSVSGVTNGQSVSYGTTVSVTVTFDKNNSKTFTVKNDTTGETILSKTSAGTYTFTMPDSSVTINVSSSGCFAEGTLITLADGTQKRIEEITFEDQLLAWDFNTGTYVATVPSLIDRYELSQQNVINLKFADGTVVRMVVDHGFFDVAANKFIFLNEENVASYVGHTFVKMGENGTYENVELVGYEITVEDVAYYSIQTAIYNNCIAEGMFTLTAPPEMLGYNGWFDYFEIGEGMKYDEEKMQADIEKYGLYTYEEFAEYVTYEQFIAFNGPYLKVLVGRGVVTFEEIIELISIYVNPTE